MGLPIHCVVTGASRGIGRAIVRRLAQRAHAMSLVGRPSPELETTLAECTRQGVRAQIVPCDLALPHQIDNAVSKILPFGRPTVLVNNAAVIERARLEDVTLDAYLLQMNTNLLAPLWLTRGLLPAMREARQGRIINIASISSTLGTANQSVYNASKWALVGFTKCLAEELSDSGVMTVALLPGSVDTAMLQGSSFPARMGPADVAETVAFYALDAPLAHNGASVEMFGT